MTNPSKGELPDEKFPSDEQLDEWASDVGQCFDEEQIHPGLAAFLRSPKLREAMRTQEAVESSRFHYCLKWGTSIPPVAIGSFSMGYEAHNACHDSKHVDVIPCMDTATSKIETPEEGNTP